MKLLWTLPLPEISFTFEIVYSNILFLALILLLKLNLFVDAFEICSSLTPVFTKCFLYKQARIHCPFRPLARILFPCPIEYLSYAFAPKFWISLSGLYKRSSLSTDGEKNYYPD